MDEDRIACLAIRFAHAIESLRRDNVSFSLKSFALGSCGESAILLAHYLQEHGFKGLEYVAGERYGTIHAWVECGALIVDITAGQFPDAPDRVIVSSDRSWHYEFEGQTRHPAEIRLYDERTQAGLREAYAQITSMIGLGLHS